ncbi:MAG: hypothetical protein K2P85_04575 [Flavobacteriaceae bacterium]|nr:hypothetical protein [Flavobacteriaceae bacterium]
MSCNCQKKAVEATSETLANAKEANVNMELIYTANTRGFYQKITVKNQEAFVSSDRNSTEKGESVKISDADWKELSGYMNDMKLDQLATYKDPTQKRFYDGAAIANLLVIDNAKEYRTVDFDNGFPPVEIEKLVNKITSLAKKE